jgi:hypothetical protein
MSKGSVRRPTDEQAYQDNYDRIFGAKPKKPEGLVEVLEHVGLKPVVIDEDFDFTQLDGIFARITRKEKP